MRIKAMAIRILSQFRHDRRTLALIIFAPLLILSLLYFIFESPTTAVKVAVINAPTEYLDQLEERNIVPVRLEEREARRALEAGEVIATVDIKSGKSYIEIDATDPIKSSSTLAMMEAAKSGVTIKRSDLKSEINYVYGYEDLSNFDKFGAIMIGFIIFFFVFLVSGISFLQERTSGTLEKMLSTPIERRQIVFGYILGFGILAVIQSIIISLYCVYVLRIMMIGNLAYILLIILFTAIAALSLGMLVSTATNNEFQMMQFIPIVIVPQVFFTGLFDLTPWLKVFGYFMPLYYVADALKKVMLKGLGLMDIYFDILVLLGFCLVFMTVNILLLKKYRRI